MKVALQDSQQKSSTAKHISVIETTYKNNASSDYTGKINDLRKAFDYESNSHVYWGEPQLSIFYGTPLYEQASETQRLGLNHLYWVSQYHHTAAAEANTMLYNQVTCGVFEKLKGYDTLCKELTFETEQERFHINTFRTIGYRTKLALMGRESLIKSVQKKTYDYKKTPLKETFYSQLLEMTKVKLNIVQEAAFRAVTGLMLSQSTDYTSSFLETKGYSGIPTTSGGLAGVTAPPSIFKFLTLNWGGSPFMAAQYYSARMIANMSLKIYEHKYYQRFRELDKCGSHIPTPLAVSYYHLLDESFHTTISQLIAQRLYKDFKPPTMYEKALANAIIFQLQRGLMGGLSGAMPAVFRNDSAFMPALYRLLTSDLFGFSQQDALIWLERCLCYEHDGFYVNQSFHQTLLKDLRRFFEPLEYLWTVNREMQLMAQGNSISEALNRNRIALQAFSQSLI
ncbi:MAG: hypothetical protein F6K11_04260 [Leptolyngbya sp. SIO3F4]|nr:hypothetical protein [Leptolyngbya sp. SIO3F4]